MPKNVSIVTGPVVGLDSSRFLEETVLFARSAGEKIVVYNLFDEMIELSGQKPANAYESIREIGHMLDGYSYQFQTNREKAYLSIANKMNALGDDVSVAIRTPASIEWRGYNIILKDHRIISEIIKPDNIITLINAEWKIEKKLKSRYGEKALQAISHKKDLSIPKILEWLASEVSVSEDWAEWASFIAQKNVRHMVVGIETPSFNNRKKYLNDVDSLAKLITQKNVPVFYASYSMTVADEGVRKTINDIIWQLRSYGVVIDPASIELGNNVEQEHKSVVFAYTVCRDLRWDVQKADAVVALHPYSERPPLSTGMMDELGHARALGKDRYLVMPVGGDSPFTAGNYIPENHLFQDSSQLFDFFEKKRRPVLKPVYQHFQKEFGKWQNSRQVQDL